MTNPARMAGAARRPRRQRASAADVPGLLARLERQTSEGLRMEWARWLPGPVPTIKSRDVLRYLIAWRVQAQVYGGYDAETARRLKQLIADYGEGKTLAPKTRRLMSPGTILTREWKGRTHKVAVEAKGFTYEGKSYASLSEIARIITGTRWSGPRLFGLEGKTP